MGIIRATLIKINLENFMCGDWVDRNVLCEMFSLISEIFRNCLPVFYPPQSTFSTESDLGII